MSDGAIVARFLLSSIAAGIWWGALDYLWTGAPFSRQLRVYALAGLVARLTFWIVGWGLAAIHIDPETSRLLALDSTSVLLGQAQLAGSCAELVVVMALRTKPFPMVALGSAVAVLAYSLLARLSLEMGWGFQLGLQGNSTVVYVLAAAIAWGTQPAYPAGELSPQSPKRGKRVAQVVAFGIACALVSRAVMETTPNGIEELIRVGAIASGAATWFAVIRLSKSATPWKAVFGVQASLASIATATTSTVATLACAAGSGLIAAGLAFALRKKFTTGEQTLLTATLTGAIVGYLAAIRSPDAIAAQTGALLLFLLGGWSVGYLLSLAGKRYFPAASLVSRRHKPRRRAAHARAG